MRFGKFLARFVIGLAIVAAIVAGSTVYVAARFVGRKNPERSSVALLDAVSNSFQRDFGTSQNLKPLNDIWERPLCSYDAASQPSAWRDV